MIMSNSTWYIVEFRPATQILHLLRKTKFQLLVLYTEEEAVNLVHRSTFYIPRRQSLLNADRPQFVLSLYSIIRKGEGRFR